MTLVTHKSAIEIGLNGVTHRVTVDNRILLTELLRDELNSLGTHIGCRTGDCGACTIFVDGQLTKSCLVLAAQTDGCQLKTIEGCDDAITRHLQEAFVAHNGFQCGFCTSGMILAAIALLQENNRPTRYEISHAIAGNLCRCTGYNAIEDAIAAAADAINRQG